MTVQAQLLLPLQTIPSNQVKAGTVTIFGTHNLTLVESELRTTRDLNLLALDTEIASFPKGIDVDNRFIVSVGGKVIGEFGANNRVVFSHYRQLLGDLLVKGKGVSSFTLTRNKPLVGSAVPTTFPLQLEFDQPTASFEIRPQTLLGNDIQPYRCGDRPSPPPDKCYWRLMGEHPSLRIYQLEVREDW